MPHNHFHRTAAWLHACGKKKGDVADLSVQIGCDMEEFIEWLKCLHLDEQREGEQLQKAIGYLESVAIAAKRRKVEVRIKPHRRIDALDALCDREVTGNGVAYLAGFDKDSADEAVLESNDDKLVDGKPILLEGGKIGKPEGWSPPDLSRFIGN